MAKTFSINTTSSTQMPIIPINPGHTNSKAQTSTSFQTAQPKNAHSAEPTSTINLLLPVQPYSALKIS